MGQQRIRWLDSITSLMDRNLSKLQEIVKDRGAWDAAVHGIEKNQTQLSNWTTTATNVELIKKIQTGENPKGQIT